MTRAGPEQPDVTVIGRSSEISQAPSLRSVGAMLLLSLMWGLSIPVTKLGLQSLPPLTLTALRFVIAVLLLTIFVLGRQRILLRALLLSLGLGC